MVSGFLGRAGLAVLAGALIGQGAAGQEAPGLTGARGANLNSYGMPGLIEMPTAGRMEEGALVASISNAGNSLRNTLSFQIAPRLTGAFRYARIDKWHPGGGETYDRSFDVQFLIAEEGDFTPSLAIGLRDIVGTGIYSGEYIVGGKTLSLGGEGNLHLTAGIGWGRLGSQGSFSNPLGVVSDRFKTRPGGFLGSGGVLGYNTWFRGPAAGFAGASWQVSDRLTLKAEYSSDAYPRETARGAIDLKTPLNVGLDWRFGRHGQLGIYALGGTEIGAQLSFGLNPRRSFVPGGREPAPVPVALRPDRATNPGAWDPAVVTAPATEASTERLIAALLEAEGLKLEAFILTETRAEVRVRNLRFSNKAQLIGRVARLMTQVIPAPVDLFVIVPVVEGIPASKVVLARGDLEGLEHDPDGAWRTYARSLIRDGEPLPEGAVLAGDLYPGYGYVIEPYTSVNAFDPDSPFRIDFGAALTGRVDIAPGFSVSGRVHQKLLGNLDDITRGAGSRLPHVRSDFAKYFKGGGPKLIDLTADYLFKPGPELYGRISAGYLEMMFAGVAAEILWKPANSNFGLGAELAYVKQRDYELGFDLLDYEVLTGHVSAYYDMGDYHAQLDVGRYLAGDLGATFHLKRVFNNGWEVGAFATLTDVPFDEFGEGSFDKGLTFTVPFDYFTGQPSQRRFSGVIRPLTRDGGARLLSKNRLYEMVKDYHDPALKDDWGRFWR